MNKDLNHLRSIIYWSMPAALATAVLATWVFAQTCSSGTYMPVTVVQTAMTLSAINQLSPPAHIERKTILLMGVDSNNGRSARFVGTRSDTIMLITIEPAAKKISVTSIPRDSRVFIKGLGLSKINAAHARGGPKLAVDAISVAFGIHIDGYVVLDTAGLKKACELVGPVEVVVEKRMNYTDRAGRLHINLKPGRQRLSPSQVEQYVRFRHDALSDIGRIQRQQRFMRQVFTRIYDPLFVCKLPQVLWIARDSIRTDLSLPDMIRIAMDSREVKPDSIFTVTLPGHAETIGGASYWILNVANTKAILNRIYGRETPVSVRMGNGAQAVMRDRDALSW